MEIIFEKNGTEYIWLSPASDTASIYWDILKELYKEYAKEIQGYTCQPVDDAPYENLEGDESFQYVVFKQKDSYIGFLGYGIPPSSFSGHDVYINGFFIREAYRRQGIGTEVAENFLKAAEYYVKDVTMEVFASNRTALNFWEKVFYDSGYVDRLSAGNIDARNAENNELIFFYYAKETEPI